MILMSVASTQAFIKDYYMKLFADTLVDYLKANYHYDSTENWNNKSVVKNKFEFDDPGKLEVLSREIIKEISEISVERLWISADVRAGRAEERWLNVILRK